MYVELSLKINKVSSQGVVERFPNNFIIFDAELKYLWYIGLKKNLQT